MSSVNLGTQKIIFSYKYPAKGSDFSKYLRNIIKAGIYSGGALSKVDNSTIQIATFYAFFNVDTDKACVIYTQNTINLTVSVATPILYMTFSWLDATNDYIDFAFRAIGSVPVTNEITLGTVGFTGSNVNGTFDLTERTYGTLDANNNIIASNKIYFGTSLDTELYRLSANVLYTPDKLQTGSDFEAAGDAIIAGTTESTNTTTGALKVAGGAGIVKNLNVGGAGTIASTTDSTSTTTGALIVTGGVGVGKRISAGTAFRFPEWATSTAYLLGDVVMRTNPTTGVPSIYWCAVGHTSGTFGADWITNSYWCAMSHAPGDEILIPTDVIPVGWSRESGTSLVKTDYTDLFARIGTRYGSADSTHFNLPLSQGLFIRNQDNGSTVDPDAANFTISSTTTSASSKQILFPSANLSQKRLVGATVTGTNIPVGTYVSSIVGTPSACNGFNLTQEATGTGSGITITVYGDNVGTKQQHAVQNFRIVVPYYYRGVGSDGSYAPTVSLPLAYTTYNPEAVTGTLYTSTETRPQNTNRILIMKL